MARRRPRSGARPIPIPRGAVKWVLLLNLAVAALGGGWYLLQPAPRQAEVRRLVGNAFEADKRVTALEVVWDLWQLYYGDSAGGKTAPGDNALVYGGPPQLAAETTPDGTTALRLLTNKAYVVGYSDSARNPLWVAYRVRDLARIPSAGERPAKFETDRRTAARVAPDDYTGSGYDRGHLAPNYAIATRHGAAAQRETFLMSNIVPQRHALNAGLWKELEQRVATNWPARYGEVWVIVGPVFGAAPPKLRGGILVPDAFFKIVIDEQDGRLRTLAFLVPQDAPTDADPARYLTSIAEIQRRTGLDFLAEIEDAAEQQIEARRADRVW